MEDIFLDFMNFANKLQYNSANEQNDVPANWYPSVCKAIMRVTPRVSSFYYARHRYAKCSSSTHQVLPSVYQICYWLLHHRGQRYFSAVLPFLLALYQSIYPNECIHCGYPLDLGRQFLHWVISSSRWYPYFPLSLNYNFPDDLLQLLVILLEMKLFHPPRKYCKNNKSKRLCSKTVFQVLDSKTYVTSSTHIIDPCQY